VGVGAVSGMQGTAVSYPTFVKENMRMELNESSVADSGYSLLRNVLFLRGNQGYSVQLPVTIESVKLLYNAS
jgi:hypothetical protein